MAGDQTSRGSHHGPVPAESKGQISWGFAGELGTDSRMVEHGLWTQTAWLQAEGAGKSLHL